MHVCVCVFVFECVFVAKRYIRSCNLCVSMQKNFDLGFISRERCYIVVVIIISHTCSCIEKVGGYFIFGYGR